MSMSKKDFIALADHIKTSNAPFTAEVLEVLGDFCQSRNGRFMRDRWIGYIKGENGPNGGAPTRRNVNRRFRPMNVAY